MFLSFIVDEVINNKIRSALLTLRFEGEKRYVLAKSDTLTVKKHLFKVNNNAWDVPYTEEKNVRKQKVFRIMSE